MNLITEDEEKEEEFNVCHYPTSKDSSFAFCDRNYSYDYKELNTCKRDFCVMCCNMNDFMFNKKHSVKAIKHCEEKCFNLFPRE